MNNQVKLNEELIVDVKRLGINGEGIAYYKKQAIFINNAIPGETVEIKILEANQKYAKGVVKRYIEESKERELPKCKYYNRCGGCQIQHIKYESGLKYKKEIVEEAIRRYSGLNTRSFEIRDAIGMENPYYYRNKSSLPTSYDGKRSVVGIYALGDNKLIFIDECIVQNQLINIINNEILKLMDKNTILAYNHKTKEGHVKYIVIRVSFYSSEAQVTLIINQKSSKLKNLSEDILKLENVVSVYEANSGENTVFGDEIKFVCGKKVITEQLGKYKFNLLPNSFFQLNPVQTVKLYNEVKKAAKLSKKEVVLDAYCGVGTIGLWVSDLAFKVIGIDNNKEAIINAKENAEINNIKNIEFYNGDVSKVVEEIKIDFDVLICDPPRTGLGDLKKFILEKKPKKVIYISCNSAMLGKDLSSLKEEYKVNYINLIDIFPFTSHVECVVLMSRLKA